MTETKEYIGDGVYAEMNEFGDLHLTTEDGISITNTIILEPDVMERLVKYWTRHALQTS